MRREEARSFSPWTPLKCQVLVIYLVKDPESEKKTQFSLNGIENFIARQIERNFHLFFTLQKKSFFFFPLSAG